MHDIQELTKKIEQITKCSKEDQNLLLRWLSRQQITQKLNIEKDRKKIFHALKEKYKINNNDLLSYCALTMSIRVQYSSEKKLSSKNFADLSLDEIQNISIVRIHRFQDSQQKNSSPKRDKLLHYWAVITMCRMKSEKPMSFMNISKYLRKFYNFKVGHNLIAELWREIETNQTKKGK